jgi:hypothetical protein
MAYSYYGRSYEQAMFDLEQRKNKNLSGDVEIYKYSELSINGKNKCLVIYDELGDIKECLCVKCFTKVLRSPYYNTKYVYPLCRYCLFDVYHIEDQNKKEQKMNQRVKKQDPNSVTINWTDFENSMASGSAKLCDLASQYNIYPVDMKELLIKKYENHIVFKKGRNGGIYWATRA